MAKPFQGKSIAILGFGREGKALFQYLKKTGTPFSCITICDQNPIESVRCATHTGASYLAGLEQFDVIFKSPGIPTKLPEIKRALRKGITLSSPTNLFFDLCKGTIVGVTGTKGKGTTATMLCSILKAAHKRVHLVGNMGKPALSCLPVIKKEDIVIMELSSFQLQHLRISPHIAIVLDITTDHLDHHKTVREYRLAKSHIVAHQTTRDIAVLDAQSPVARTFARHTPAQIVFFGKAKTRGTLPRGVWIDGNEIISITRGQRSPLLATSSLRVPGIHNARNAAAAIAAARALLISPSAIQKGIQSFRGNAHRLEFVAEKKGVRFYNDSAGTNPDATIAALRAFREPKLLIVGGRNKGFSYDALAKELTAQHMRGVVLLGETAPLLYNTIKKIAPKKFLPCVIRAATLPEAVEKASALSVPGDVVVYSPAATSFDMFHNYEERGTIFKNLIRMLS
ncbi:MAG: UDP-N-acetylmuramoyl-L-alanine--D-glutamate ligase [Patescibacteria group bacterium]|nr:UDP-N-acetylmuramoyl-L-alanine--D-glutamate ligase [Patescibacteria group bacterium]MDE2438399.1 UDP-N-acetylmuramoyl-L-alanine--D-glutamate ligase [Patescibacteria group bacterium]